MGTEATAAFAEHIHHLDYADLPDVVVERAKLAILDTIGVAMAGSGQPTGRMVTEYARRSNEGPRVATVLGLDLALSAEAAAFVNGCFAHVLDYDDRGHSSVHTLPAVLAVAEELDRSGADVLVGYVAGREVRMRLNEEMDVGTAQLKGGLASRGWHATGVLGALGSSAGVGKVLGLDPDRLRMALGLAGSLASGLMSNRGTMTKCVHAGNAARNGVLSARLAEQGFTADPSVLSSRGGLVDALCPNGECDLERVLERLRTDFHLAEVGVRFKPYPSCSPTHPYIEAVRAVREQHGLTADEVASIACTATPSLVYPRPRNGLESKFSASFAVVATVVEGEVNLRTCTDEFLARQDVQRLLERTEEVEADGAGWVRVRTVGGEEHVAALGKARDLVTYDEVAHKFHDCADPVIGVEAADAVESAVRRLEDVESVRTLTARLRPA